MNLRSALRRLDDDSDFMYMLIFFSVMLFFMGLMLVDYGASFKDLPIFAQSLAFDHINVRVVYHTGITCLISSFVISNFTAFHFVVKMSRRCPICRL